jgi:CubicO group peptidase (beta-lactamase class C family)
MKLWPALALGAILIGTAAAQDPSLTDLGVFIPDLMAKGHVPGLSIAVIREGKIAWTGAFGVKNTETGEFCDEETIFEAASLTKPLCAYLALLYVAEGKLDLDTPLIDYLPEQVIIDEILNHPLDEPGFRRDWFEKITARHVLSHSSGMPHGEPNDPHYPLFFEPGNEYRYSAPGYYYLQLILEKMEDAPLEEIAQKRVLGPLGMTHSSLVWREAYEQTAASGHGEFGDPASHRRWSRAHAGASMYTTAGDYARFVCAVMNHAQLSAEDTARMLTSQIEIDDNLSWSLGFGRQRDANGTAFWQWGDYGIYRNYILAYEDSRSAVIWLTNSNNGLGIAEEMLTRTIGSAAHAIAFLGYVQYDSPIGRFYILAMDAGAAAAIARLAEFRAEDPDFMSEGTVNGIGYSMLNADRIDDAIAFFELNTQEHPQSSNSWDSLAEAHMKAGGLEKAIDSYRRSLELDETNRNAEQRIAWIKAGIEAREHPIELTAEELARCAGKYGPRRIRVQDGKLYYQREDTGNPERLLHALKPNLFSLDGNPDCRFRFDVNEDGQVIAIEGWTAAGKADRHERE